MGDPQVKSFCENYSLRCLIKQPTCYKSPTSPTYIELILTNKLQSFQSTCVLETEQSDFHFFFFYYLDFLSQPLTIHRTAREGGGDFFNSSLSL